MSGYALLTVSIIANAMFSMDLFLKVVPLDSGTDLGEHSRIASSDQFFGHSLRTAQPCTLLYPERHPAWLHLADTECTATGRRFDVWSIAMGTRARPPILGDRLAIGRQKNVGISAK